MAREGTATPIDPGVIARLVQGVRYALTGVKPDTWFGPGQPLAPVAQEQAVGRAFDFPVNVNTRMRPRDAEPVSFEQMRGLADGYDFLRLVIETRKDQLCALQWGVRPVDESEPDARCLEIERFFARPDREHDWQTWLRMVLEDMLVLDAATIYPRLTRGGAPYAFELIDGATIKRVIGVDGRTPLPPDPAYQQVLKGMPAVDYSRDELIYAMRNPRTNRSYGYSPVEQIVMTVNIAMRRQLSQLQYYTEGNVPEAMIGVPDTWNPDQIRQFQDYWDAILEGNTGARRHAKFVPGGMEIHETRPGLMKDAFDEWLARIVCYAFSISPGAFMAQMNRSTAETSKAAAAEEGLVPAMQWIKSLINRIIALWFNAPDLCFDWHQEHDVDPLTQAQINKIYIDAKVLTPDEVRADLGKDPLTPEQRAELSPPQLMSPGTPPGAPGEAQEGQEEGQEEDQAQQAKTKALMPEIHIHNAAPEVLVDIGAMTVTAHFDPPADGFARKSTQTMLIDRAAIKPVGADKLETPND
jgi:hypothetical protein